MRIMLAEILIAGFLWMHPGLGLAQTQLRVKPQPNGMQSTCPSCPPPNYCAAMVSLWLYACMLNPFICQEMKLYIQTAGCFK